MKIPDIAGKNEHHLQPRWIESGAILGLLVAIAVAGLVGLGINARVRSITEQVIKFDIELEDRGDDLRVAVLDMRHYHRNLVFAGPSRKGLADLEVAYIQLLAQIDQLDSLGIDHLPVVSPDELRLIAKHYYAEFRPAIDLYYSDPQEFDRRSDSGLQDLVELETAALEIHFIGEQRAAAALRMVESAMNSAQVVLLTVLGGLILVGVGLAYLIVRNRHDQQRAAAELGRALQLKTDFIADASHELRTPLTVVRANAEVALTLDSTWAHADLLAEIVRESEQMTRLVEDLLFLARSDAGSMPLEMEWIHIEPFFTELTERARVLVREQSATFHTNLSASGFIYIDRMRIEQAILILVDNAAKYSPANRPITMSSQIRGNDLVIEVSDHGAGIPPADLPLIFERFYRVDKARTRKQGGSGLGLAIAKSIIETHGGQIEAESQIGRGTVMRVHLPSSPAPQPARSLVKSLVIEESA